MKRTFAKTHLRNALFVLMAVLSASTAFAQAPDPVPGEDVGYVIYSGSFYYDAEASATTDFDPATCIWTVTDGIFYNEDDDDEMYITTDPSCEDDEDQEVKHCLDVSDDIDDATSFNLGSENGTTIGKTVTVGSNLIYIVFQPEDWYWITSANTSRYTPNVAFSVTKYTFEEVNTAPTFRAPTSFTQLGSQSCSILSKASYSPAYSNYYFCETDHCFNEDGSPLIPESITYRWRLSSDAVGHVSVSSEGVVTYDAYYDEDTEVVLTLSAYYGDPEEQEPFAIVSKTISFKSPNTPTNVSATDMTVYVGQQKKAEVTLTPNPCYRNLEFASSSTDIATVDNNGVVTGVSTGTAVVTVTAHKYNSTDVLTTTFTVTVRNKVKTPVITFEPNESDDGATATATIACACETEEATIYYTTDGSTPTSASSQYASPFDVGNATTVTAIAINAGEDWDNSDVVVNTYHKRSLSKPTIQINNGSVTFTCAEPGVTFRYTTGENPVDPTPSTTTTWTEGSSAITTGITNEHIIKVIATKSGWLKSEVASRQYIMASGVSDDGVVTLNDLEDHNWTLYQGVKTTDDANYNTNYEGKFYFPDPKDVKIIYNANGGAVSKYISANQFVYYKTLAKENDAYKYTTIPNPFSKRPKDGENYQGFSKWKITRIDGGTITDKGVGSEVDAETELTFVPSSEYGMEVVFDAVWTTAHVEHCSATDVNTKLSTTEWSGNSYETNFIVITGGNSSTLGDENSHWALDASSSKPVTITMVEPDGTTDHRSELVYINPSVITLSNDWKFEYININARQFTKSYTTIFGTPTEIIYTIITANNHNLVLGRGISHTSGSISAGTVEGMTNEDYEGNLNYKIRVESGEYDYLSFVNGYVDRSGPNPSGGTVVFSGNNMRITGVLGSDYDRATSNNDSLKIYKQIMMGDRSKFSKADNISHETLNVTVKSGNFHPECDNHWADINESFYLSLADCGQTNVGRRVMNIEGGQFLSIAGGIDEKNSAADETFYLRMSGGHVRGSIYGCGAFAEASGHRRFIITGGKIDGWIATGCNGTGESDYQFGTLRSDTYLYIGGTTTVGNKNGTPPPHINASDGGNVFGAGSGNSKEAQTGQVNNSNIVIADESFVQNNVYGGGNYGFSDATAKIYVTGGTVAGKVFGGANQKQGNTVNILMTGGLVEGGVYGGSNITGTINDNVTIQINGGQVGLDAEHTANVHGGGYGQDTRVTGNVDVTLGTNTDGVTAGSAVIYGDVYGGSALGYINGESVDAEKHTKVTLNAGTINGNLYGGALGNNIIPANVYAPVTVTVNGGEVTNVFGCNNVNGKPQSTVNVLMRGGMVHECVYGGGNAADYTGNPVVTVRGGEVRQNVYGGGLGSEAIITGSTHVTIQGTAHVYGNVYGGGNGGKVTGNTHVDIGGASE